MTVAVLDYVLAGELAFFYLLPLAIAGWYIGKKAAVTVALAGAAAFPLTDVLRVGPELGNWSLFWNFAVRGATLVSMAFMVGRLREALERERQLARKDPLTGIANARWFDEIGTWECARARRSGQPLSVAYMDLDGFKSINDTLGHSEGDRALLSVATTLEENTRATDLVARLGGDEFALLMPATDENACRALIARLTSTFKSISEHRHTLSFSIGLVTFHGPPANIDDALRVADQLMYEAKGSGKDCFRQRTVRAVADLVEERAQDGLLIRPG